jgi:hypothetical protein
MRFLDGLSSQLAAVEQKMQALPEELDSIMVRINRDKWRNLLVRVNEDSNKLLDRLSTHQIHGVLSLSLIFDLQSFSLTPITSEDRARWRDAHKPDIRFVIGKGKVRVMAVSEASGEGEAEVSQIISLSQQQEYIMLNWDQYQKLLDEIGKLISGND